MRDSTIRTKRRTAAAIVGATPPPEPPEGFLAAVPTASSLKSEIQDYLDEQGVDYPSDATKAELVEVLEGYQAE